MNKLPISLLIPTMNRPISLEETLKSFFEGDSIPSQLIVVDQSEVEEVAFKNKKVTELFKSKCEVKYIHQNIPSLTKARNKAFEYAKEEIVLCSDDDVMIYEDTLKNLYELMSNREIAMVGGINDREHKSKTNIGYFFGTKSFKNRKIGHVTNSMLGRLPDIFSEEVLTMWTMGFFFCIKKSLKERWKLKWDEKLPGYAYGEDLDFSYAYYKAAKNENLKCIYSSKIHVQHLASTEFRVPTRKHTFMYVLNRAYLCHKHNMGRKGEIAMAWCNFWRYIEKYIKKENPKDFREAILYYRQNKKLVDQGIFPYDEKEDKL